MKEINWEKEYNQMKENAYEFYMAFHKLLKLLKKEAPQEYQKFVESYGGENKFQDFYNPPIKKKEEGG